MTLFLISFPEEKLPIRRQNERVTCVCMQREWRKSCQITPTVHKQKKNSMLTIFKADDFSKLLHSNNHNRLEYKRVFCNTIKDLVRESEMKMMRERKMIQNKNLQIYFNLGLVLILKIEKFWLIQVFFQLLIIFAKKS